MLYKEPRLQSIPDWKAELIQEAHQCSLELQKYFGDHYTCCITIHIDNVIFSLVKRTPLSLHPVVYHCQWSPKIVNVYIWQNSLCISGFSLHDATIFCMDTNQENSEYITPPALGYTSTMVPDTALDAIGSISIYSINYAIASLRCPPLETSYHSLESVCHGCSLIQTVAKQTMTRELPKPRLLQMKPNEPIMIFAQKNGITSEMYLYNSQ